MATYLDPVDHDAEANALGHDVIDLTVRLIRASGVVEHGRFKPDATEPEIVRAVGQAVDRLNALTAARTHAHDQVVRMLSELHHTRRINIRPGAVTLHPPYYCGADALGRVKIGRDLAEVRS